MDKAHSKAPRKTFAPQSSKPRDSLTSLQRIRSSRRKVKNAKIVTRGVPDYELAKFKHTADFQHVVTDAFFAKDVSLPVEGEGELERAERYQKGFLQFYDPTTVNPYVPIAARGPWVITDTGSVVYDAGGYGMLGFGHAPQHLLKVLSNPFVQANIMTPSHYQADFMKAMKREIGNTRGFNLDGSACPYDDFVVINSGSESVSFAMRVADADAKHKTAAHGPAAGKKTCLISLDTSFHGRTERPAHASDSSRPSYKKHLKSFEDIQVPLFTIPVNDSQALQDLFTRLEAEGYHPEMMLMEATQGEGNPGVRLTREFYDTARSLTKKHHSLLLIDSIQAGFRATGQLSLMDYPGFNNAEVPDFETFSKALNGGQYPMSAVAFGPGIASIYQKGLYGNTMTGNPRALAIASATLAHITPDVKANILQKGDEMVQMFEQVAQKYSNLVEGVSGSGLLNALHLRPDVKAYGSTTSVEYIARTNGLGVIHGGKNALRFTPHFNMTSEEVQLVKFLVEGSLEGYAKTHDIKIAQ